jgi:hypothetical protein
MDASLQTALQETARQTCAPQTSQIRRQRVKIRKFFLKEYSNTSKQVVRSPKIIHLMIFPKNRASYDFFVQMHRSATETERKNVNGITHKMGEKE